jgi:hypothetical protein
MPVSAKQDDHYLAESIPAPLVIASWRNYVIWIGGPVALFCLAISIGAWLHSGWQACLLLSVILWGLAALLVFGTAGVLNHNLKKQIPSVKLRHDEISVVYGDRTLAAKVSECHVHRGRAFSMHLVGGVKLYSCLPVILIDFPPRWYPWIGMTRPRLNTVAVGYTNTMRGKWELALVECRANHPMQPSGEVRRFEMEDQPSPPADR